MLLAPPESHPRYAVSTILPPSSLYTNFPFIIVSPLHLFKIRKVFFCNLCTITSDRSLRYSKLITFEVLDQLQRLRKTTRHSQCLSPIKEWNARKQYPTCIPQSGLQASKTISGRFLTPWSLQRNWADSYQGLDQCRRGRLAYQTYCKSGTRVHVFPYYLLYCLVPPGSVGIVNTILHSSSSKRTVTLWRISSAISMGRQW